MSLPHSFDRRQFLKLSSVAALMPATDLAARAATPTTTPQSKADYTVRIANSQIELAPGHVISTTTYNGQFPGPLIRLTEGRRVVIDIQNDTGIPEQLHWHGQNIPVDVDRAAEEGTPYIPAHGARRIEYTPGLPA